MARTIEFNRPNVLKKAMELFWQDGYCKTSISSLVTATKLKPGSLYAAFKSKEGLFLEALDYYGQRSANRLQGCLDKADTPLHGVTEFILQIIDETRDKNPHQGCFLVNTVLEITSDETEIKNEVNKHLSAIESILVSALMASQKEGELPVHKNPDELAKFLMVNIWGLRVLAKTNPDEETIRVVQDQLLMCLKV